MCRLPVPIQARKHGLNVRVHAEAGYLDGRADQSRLPRIPVDGLGTCLENCADGQGLRTPDMGWKPARTVAPALPTSPEEG